MSGTFWAGLINDAAAPVTVRAKRCLLENTSPFRRLVVLCPVPWQVSERPGSVAAEKAVKDSTTAESKIEAVEDVFKIDPAE